MEAFGLQMLIAPILVSELLCGYPVPLIIVFNTHACNPQWYFIRHSKQPKFFQPEPKQPGPNQPEPKQPKPNQPEPKQPKFNQSESKQLKPKQPGPNQPKPKHPRHRPASALIPKLVQSLNQPHVKVKDRVRHKISLCLLESLQ
jgi:hypothetical protein